MQPYIPWHPQGTVVTRTTSTDLRGTRDENGKPHGSLTKMLHTPPPCHRQSGTGITDTSTARCAQGLLCMYIFPFLYLFYYLVLAGHFLFLRLCVNRFFIDFSRRVLHLMHLSSIRLTTLALLAPFLANLPLVRAHGYVAQVTIDGKVYVGNVPNAQPTPSIVRQINDISPVKGASNAYLNCGQDAQKASLVANANPGSQVQFLWLDGDGTNVSLFSYLVRKEQWI